MSELIGRHHGRRGGGRRPGLRRSFGGGWGGWWPRWPYWTPWPIAIYDPRGMPYGDATISGGPGGGALCEDDVHEHPRRRQAAAIAGNELFALLPVIAPGASGLSCEMCLDRDLQLRVLICVDGQCYAGSADMSGVLREIARGVAGAHAQTGQPSVTPQALDHVSAHADKAVERAGLMVVGALYDQHVDAVSSGWFDKVKGGVLSVYRTASSPVTWLNKNVAKGLKKLEPAVTIAATAVATAYGGPAAGAAASKLTGPLLDSTAKTGGDPTRLFDKVKKQAGDDPVVDQAVDTAKQAVAQTAAAYHLNTTATDAAKGDQNAAAKIAQLEAAAAGGDEAAATAMRVIGEALNAQATNRAAEAGAPAAASIASGAPWWWVQSTDPRGIWPLA